MSLPTARDVGAVRPTRATAAALILDADRTLAPGDTGRAVGAILGLNGCIRSVFEACGYTDRAFQAVAACWATAPEGDYLAAVAEVADRVALRPAWLTVLTGLTARCEVQVVTAGIPQVWRRALARHGLSGIPVVGGCRAGLDPYCVTPACKAAAVEQRQAQGAYVVAAGDSEIDLPMLTAADLPLFVADAKGSPRLLARLNEAPHTCHFVTDGRRFDGLPALTPAEVIGRLTREGARHAA
ncbi:MAG: haloacid dehalogenase-like hydrolase [Myxococcales bacterium]|nr:haloacid dehalogenase-like hydrolase [Myxococcales bacterium]MCB9526242.1 haloacid dehalogenase-like hydrolase [Myxococcales bacterium]